MGKTNWVAGATIIAGITLLVLILTNLSQITDNITGNPINTDNPFIIELSPTYFDEGNYNYQYDEIPFSIDLIKKFGRNITYLELSKDNFKVSRKDGGLNKPTSQVNWKDSRSDILISINPSGYYSSSNLKAEGEMSLCQNCFIGDNYPYVFTFTIYWKEDGRELKSEIFNVEIPIK
jgi:hypothetical protein